LEAYLKTVTPKEKLKEKTWQKINPMTQTDENLRCARESRVGCLDRSKTGRAMVGARGFTLTTHSKDLRAGGTWDLHHARTDGTDYPNLAKYYEVEKYSRPLSMTIGGSRDREPFVRVTVTFTETKGKTKMDMTMTLPTAEAAIEIQKFIKQAAGYATWDRVGRVLRENSSGKEKFFINVLFHASLETMFQMWIDPAHFESGCRQQDSK